MQNLEARKIVAKLLCALDAEDHAAFQTWEIERSAAEWRAIAGAAIIELYDALWHRQTIAGNIREALEPTSIIEWSESAAECYEDAGKFDSDCDGLPEYFDYTRGRHERQRQQRFAELSSTSGVESPRPRLFVVPERS